MTKEEMKTRKEQIIEILKSWLQANDGTIFTDDFAISQITNEILALLPTDDDAGIIAVNIASAIEPKLTAQEEVFFVAGFKECAKYLRNK